jgi:glucose-6-phosphate dehydrogenase assembly protein OpcA
LRTVREVQAELGRLLDATDEETLGAALRTSVMTHVGWVPGPWRDAAETTLAGLGERHPSRTILLFPEPDAAGDGLEAEVALRRFDEGRGPAVCSEVVSIRLLGRVASRPASVVVPLLRSDLPVFVRWRGSLPHGAPELDELVAVADRLVVDGREWPDPAAGYAALPALFDAVAVSDVVWARLEGWRRAVAALWPDVADAGRLRVRGPEADALLLVGWLSARLRRTVVLERESAEETELVDVDGQEARPDRHDRPTPSDLLSAELEIFGRDPIFEEAVWSCTSQTTSSRSRPGS